MDEIPEESRGATASFLGWKILGIGGDRYGFGGSIIWTGIEAWATFYFSQGNQISHAVESLDDSSGVVLHVDDR
ncbi:unnamed protein product [Linum trigynum]|uniref:Uncharacterized protein n=1 Tax=Linum trigynum TaxID=586398 RepID=A0AAV2E720_9ROSI